MNKMKHLANQNVVFKNIKKQNYEDEIGVPFLKELGTSDNEIIKSEIIIYPFQIDTYFSRKENRFLFPLETIHQPFNKFIKIVTHSEKDLLDTINALNSLQNILGKKEINAKVNLEVETMNIDDLKNLHDFKNFLHQNGGIDITPINDHLEIILPSCSEKENDSSQFKYIRISTSPEYLQWCYSNNDCLEKPKYVGDDIYVIPNVDNFELLHQYIQLGHYKLYMDYFLLNYKDVKDIFPVFLYNDDKLIKEFSDLDSLLQYTKRLLVKEKDEAIKSSLPLKTFSFLQRFDVEGLKNKFKLSPIISKSEVLKNNLQLDVPNFLKYVEQKGWNVSTKKKEDSINHLSIELFPYSINFRYSDLGQIPFIFYPLHVDAWGEDHEIISTHEQLLSFIDSVSAFHDSLFEPEIDAYGKDFLLPTVPVSESINISDDDLPF